ncbi:hypothetical protein QYF61_027798 [Mycteria americana]|uniref:Uncharacterized protein n=1 Tax=Mycteria americana TaxID=33587 RepID=A0AAN7N4M7_MYCAM|nr:hypothetical protein QYF61_027798 [Mycteria americana]
MVTTQAQDDPISFNNGKGKGGRPREQFTDEYPDHTPIYAGSSFAFDMTFKGTRDTRPSCKYGSDIVIIKFSGSFSSHIIPLSLLSDIELNKNQTGNQYSKNYGIFTDNIQQEPTVFHINRVELFLNIEQTPSCKGNTESQNHIGWKRPLRSSPTVSLTLPRPPLYHVPKHLIQTSFKYLQGWPLNHFPGQPVPMLDNPFSEVKFPNIQSKPPLAQLEAISSCPIACYLGEETDPHLATTSFQVVVESDKVSPQPPSLQAKPPQFPQPLLIRLLL